MKRENFYTLVIILLLLLNFATIGYLLLGKDGKKGHMPPPPPPGADNVIIEKLHLNEDQQQQFEIFKRRHRKSMDSVQRNIKDAQKALFTLVKNEEMDMPMRDSLLHEIEKDESAKHLITIQHFHDLRSIMEPKQVELFNEFIEEIGGRITGPGRPPHGPPPPHGRP
ncbi:MAG: periplasmic heavy metal sensor [Chitinophagales bacterium]|nr:periplasmic heavy metal sensor [Chitinophagaceae bacterium]MCB9065906.1 periplasmic heavy metal sensor [Chitinophagales bacterium]